MGSARPGSRRQKRLAARATAPVSVALIVMLLTSAGCHTMRFEVAKGPAAPVVEERKSFFFWGLAPTLRVDMATRCPYGVARITERTTFVDGLFELLTLGIWSPRSTTYSCREAPVTE